MIISRAINNHSPVYCKLPRKPINVLFTKQRRKYKKKRWLHYFLFFYSNYQSHSVLKTNLQDIKSHSQPHLPLKTHYFSQIIDLFNLNTKSCKNFNQKYLINAKNWQCSGPIFVWTGNEGAIEELAARTGCLLDITPLITLADYAVPIRSLKQNLTSEDSPVVVFGGSYGGRLPAWFPLKFPYIKIGALACSAPILQLDNIVPLSRFFDAISEDFKVSLAAQFSCSGRWFSWTKQNFQDLQDFSIWRVHCASASWITTDFGRERIDKVLVRFANNIIFSNGMQNPWSRGSVLENVTDSIVAFATEKWAHHTDLRSATKDDPDWLIEQSREEVEIIQGWINRYYADHKKENQF
ncbi:lysosomal Pro-X carboxypeptidase-like [Punica granatum]|uniref:Lysosomal Pro-X carboxypeptidase-like n=1 Tax=Punica granatum TaxID=22663 RepID=A0A6P8C954_PUNGR|nr:lysosomal Pro-X carboxypeptidase-like [Punica granatum]